LISNWDNPWTVIHATPIIKVMTARHAQIWKCNMFKLFGKWVVTKCSWSLVPNKDLSNSHPHVNVSHANKFKESNWMEFRSFPIQVDFPMLEYVLKHIFVCIKHHQDWTRSTYIIKIPRPIKKLQLNCCQKNWILV
jgi:hypothetical protein